MTTITRFAPSPTGRLHVGNIRTALHNWLLARQSGGRFILRVDDTDDARSREEYVDAIREDLRWLGLDYDEEHRQSERLALYESAFDALKAAGRVYPAYETAQELEIKRKIQLGRGKPPIYDRASLALTPQQRAEKDAQGISPHWRFKLDHDQQIRWDDGIRGAQKFDPALLSDPVIRRADGSWLYMLPSAVDDLDMGVTDVLRGEDHVSNTAVQIQIFTALIAALYPAAKLPSFAHEALLVGREGKLSKRLGSLGCDTFREDGIEPMAILSLLARLGTSQPVEPVSGRDVLVDSFDLSTFSRAPAKFDEAEIARLNAAIVHDMDFDAVADRLPDGIDEAGWHAIRPNLTRIDEAAQLWQLVSGPIPRPDLDDADRDYVSKAADMLVWSDTPWQDLTSALKQATDRKGRSLFMPLRLALTGVDHGPDMKELMPLIGETEVRRRLVAASAG